MKTKTVKSKQKARSRAATGSTRLTKLEAKLVEQLAHVRVESTHGLAGQCRCSIAGANNALMRLHRLGLVGIEHKGVRGTHGHPTVWYGKEPPHKCDEKKGILKSFSFKLTEEQYERIAKEFLGCQVQLAAMLAQPQIWFGGSSGTRVHPPTMKVAVLSHSLFKKLQAVLIKSEKEGKK